MRECLGFITAQCSGSHVRQNVGSQPEFAIAHVLANVATTRLPGLDSPLIPFRRGQRVGLRSKARQVVVYCSTEVDAVYVVIL